MIKEKSKERHNMQNAHKIKSCCIMLHTSIVRCEQHIPCCVDITRQTYAQKTYDIHQMVRIAQTVSVRRQLIIRLQEDWWSINVPKNYCWWNVIHLKSVKFHIYDFNIIILNHLNIIWIWSIMSQNLMNYDKTMKNW